jgi:hypothetical protein
MCEILDIMAVAYILSGVFTVHKEKLHFYSKSSQLRLYVRGDKPGYAATSPEDLIIVTMDGNKKSLFLRL